MEHGGGRRQDHPGQPGGPRLSWSLEQESLSPPFRHPPSPTSPSYPRIPLPRYHATGRTQTPDENIPNIALISGQDQPPDGPLCFAMAIAKINIIIPVCHFLFVFCLFVQSKGIFVCPVKETSQEAFLRLKCPGPSARTANGVVGHTKILSSSSSYVYYWCFYYSYFCYCYFDYLYHYFYKQFCLLFVLLITLLWLHFIFVL